MVWILIAYLADYKAGSSIVAEFNTHEACISALEEIESRGGNFYKPTFAICTPKG